MSIFLISSFLICCYNTKVIHFGENIPRSEPEQANEVKIGPNLLLVIEWKSYNLIKQLKICKF